MIQINLLPDIKAEYVKAERTKRTVIAISMIVIAASLGVVFLLTSIAFGVQTAQLNSAQSSIDENVAEIKSDENLDEVLTVQSQLLELTPLHESKPVVSRLFTYLQQTTPQDVLLDTYQVDFDNNVITVEGSAPSLEIINKYVDTLKFTEIVYGTEAPSGQKAFNTVVLIEFDKSNERSEFQITMNSDPALFKLSANDIKLLVPNIITTRSQTQSPVVLFEPNESEDQ